MSSRSFGAGSREEHAGVGGKKGTFGDRLDASSRDSAGSGVESPWGGGGEELLPPGLFGPLPTAPMWDLPSPPPPLPTSAPPSAAYAGAGGVGGGVVGGGGVGGGGGGGEREERVVGALPPGLGAGGSVTVASWAAKFVMHPEEFTVAQRLACLEELAPKWDKDSRLAFSEFWRLCVCWEVDALRARAQKEHGAATTVYLGFPTGAEGVSGKTYLETSINHSVSPAVIRSLTDLRRHERAAILLDACTMVRAAMAARIPLGLVLCHPGCIQPQGILSILAKDDCSAAVEALKTHRGGWVGSVAPSDVILSFCARKIDHVRRYALKHPLLALLRAQSTATPAPAQPPSPFTPPSPPTPPTKPWWSVERVHRAEAIMLAEALAHNMELLGYLARVAEDLFAPKPDSSSKSASSVGTLGGLSGSLGDGETAGPSRLGVHFDLWTALALARFCQLHVLVVGCRDPHTVRLDKDTVAEIVRQTDACAQRMRRANPTMGEAAAYEQANLARLIGVAEAMEQVRSTPSSSSSSSSSLPHASSPSASSRGLPSSSSSIRTRLSDVRSIASVSTVPEDPPSSSASTWEGSTESSGRRRARKSRRGTEARVQRPTHILRDTVGAKLAQAHKSPPTNPQDIPELLILKELFLQPQTVTLWKALLKAYQ